ncbi:transducin-like enhancer protein 6 isoform X2 [Rousettus aegyptiacus]|uniref:transducin-like enhancer protein 6 isoform X2 n=1 Tax=Rousettus aegyptiacus TaxID=9407 RepID=UPI00168D7A6F|nr:transducin-like enhancer protein 6 isoform X2 [Rousettus aegyptiacus]
MAPGVEGGKALTWLTCVASPLPLLNLHSKEGKSLQLLLKDDLLGPSGLPGAPSKDSEPPRNFGSRWGQPFSHDPSELPRPSQEAVPQLQRLRQDLQEHHRQAEHFLRTMETYSQPPCGEQADPEAPWQPGVKPPQLSGLQGSAFEDIAARRSSDWLQRPSGVDGAPARQLATQSCWNSEPQFWHDILTLRLWEIFTRNPNKTDAPRHRPTEQMPGLQSWEPGPCYSGVEPSTEDATGNPGGRGPSATRGRARRSPAFVSAQFSARRHPPTAPLQVPQERARGQACHQGGRALVWPRCWDPEEFEDTWKRPDALPRPSNKLAVPCRVERKRVLRHGEPVLAAAVSSFTRHAFTCGRSGVKVWSLVRQVAEDRLPESHLPVQHHPADGWPQPGRRERVGPDGAHAARGRGAALCRPHLPGPGRQPGGQPGLRRLHQWHRQNLGPAGPQRGQGPAGPPKWSQEHFCQRPEHLGRGSGRLPAVLGPEGPRGASGTPIRVPGGALTRCLPATCLQIISMSPSPREDWLLVGTANGQQWLQPTCGGEKRLVGCKASTILGLKFSPLGWWWVSVGMDNLVSICSMPRGAVVVQVPETSSVTCCDVSLNNRLVVTGSRDHASVYQIAY